MREGAILYEDDHLLVVDKPSGSVVHRGWADDCPIVADWVREYLGVSTVHPVHRLDRGTSGPVMFAKHPAAARAMSEAFQAGAVTKAYLALVRGVPPEPRGGREQQGDGVGGRHRRISRS